MINNGIKAPSHLLCILVKYLLSYQAVGDNKDKIESLKETAKRLLAAEKVANRAVPKVAEQALL
jgi:hypothetical protein